MFQWYSNEIDEWVNIERQWHPYSQTFNEILNDIILLSKTLNGLLTINPTLTDNITFIETISNSLTVNPTLIDNILLSDNVLKLLIKEKVASTLYFKIASNDLKFKNDTDIKLNININIIKIFN